MEYAWMIAGSVQLLGELKSNSQQAAAQLKDAGHTAESLRSFTKSSLYEWRARVCELHFDSLELLAMVEVEYRATEATMSIYNQKVKKLQESKRSIDVVAGRAAEKKRLEEWAMRELEQMRGSSKAPSPQAVADPTAYAKRQRDKIDEVVQALATICDTAMSDDVPRPSEHNDWQPITFRRLSSPPPRRFRRSGQQHYRSAFPGERLGSSAGRGTMPVHS